MITSDHGTLRHFDPLFLTGHVACPLKKDSHEMEYRMHMQRRCKKMISPAFQGDIKRKYNFYNLGFGVPRL